MRQLRVLLISAAAAALLVLPSTASAAGDFPLRGWWPLNEGKGQTIKDWSGKGNHGYLGSTPTADANDPTWVKGIFFGTGLNFNGNQFATIPNDDSLEPAALTVGAWVRAPNSPGTFKYVLAKGGDACVTASYGLQTGFHGGLEFYIWDGGAQRWSGNVNAAQIWDGKWHHVAGTFDGREVKLFVDGNLVPGGSTQTADIDYTLPTTPDATLGGYRGTCDLLFTGDVDELHVWSQALPVDQIWDRWGWLLGYPNRAQ
jgi:hypothetical protein